MQNWFRRCSTLAALALAVSATTAAPASAQSVTYGLLAGAAFRTLIEHRFLGELLGRDLPAASTWAFR